MPAIHAIPATACLPHFCPSLMKMVLFKHWAGKIRFAMSVWWVGGVITVELKFPMVDSMNGCTAR